jgi:hypothetical protein
LLMGKIERTLWVKPYAERFTPFAVRRTPYAEFLFTEKEFE